ncbi:RNA polymerase sigma-F factor [Clostridia bacterium]|nr:RNA polymerase sigma-F factor [Clostridia bacterium]
MSCPDIESNQGLIWSVARRFFGQGVEPEDLFQLGAIGYIKAAQGFDENYGTRFSTYAVPKIAGEIRRFLRDDGMVKVSRGLKERASLIRQTRRTLCQTLGREPLLSELSAECGLSAEDIAAAELAVSPTESLQYESGEDGATLESVIGTDGMEESVTESLALRQAIDELPEREKTVVDLRFYRGLTQDKAAKIIGISQVQVSRLEKTALNKLRRRLTV